MGQLSSNPPPAPATEGRLESWKEIAAYLKKSVRTVQQWEKKEGLPVYRRQHDKLGTVYAYRAELDAWWRNGHARLEASEAEEAPQASTQSRRWVLTAGVAAALVVAAGVGYLAWRRSTVPVASPTGKVMLAVLPFENLSQDPEQEYFSDGLTEEMITQLGRLHPDRLGVIARTSAMQYKATNKTVEQVGRELGVEYVLEGSVWRAGEQVRINAQLIQVSDQAHLWADSYEGELGNVFALQSEVARAVAREVGVTLNPQMEVALARPPPVNRKAYEAYLRGRYLNSKLTEAESRKALEYFQEAVREDPGYALAYVGLAGCYTGLAEHNWLPASEAYPKAVAAAEKALEIDGNLSEAYSMLASISFIHDWDWLGAEEKYRRAIALNPNNAGVRVAYAIYLTARGQHAESLAEIKRAQELDPVSLSVGMNLGVRLYYARQYTQAIKELQRALELYPDSNLLLHSLGHAYLQAGMYEEAIATLQKAETLYGSNAHNRALLAEVYLAAGKRAEARKLLDELLRQAKQGKAHSRDIAGVYVALGQNEQAFPWLEKAYEARDPYLRYIKVDPRLDPLRSDPRFQALLRRMNFPEN